MQFDLFLSMLEPKRLEKREINQQKATWPMAYLSCAAGSNASTGACNKYPESVLRI